MTKRKIRPEFLGFAEELLKKEKISYKKVCENGDMHLLTGLSSKEFHLLVEHAMCLHQQENSKSKLPVKSFNDIMSGNVKEMEFVVLRKDTERFLNSL